MSEIARRLVAAGLSGPEAEVKDALFAAAARAIGADDASWRWFVPGRIEVLGKHTDYAGGRSLICAAERGMCVVAAPRSDALIRIVDAIRREALEVPFSSRVTMPSGWGHYVATVAHRVAANFPNASRGVDLGIASDLPRAAGMSSSSALIVAVFVALAAANRLCEEGAFAEVCLKAEDLAEYIACIENGQTFRGLAGDRGVGTFGGSEDHTAILCCVAGRLSRYRFCPIALESRVRLPPDWAFVVATSGIRAAKIGDARDRYNHASLAARAVLDAWRTVSGHADATLGSALRDDPGSADAIREAVGRARRSDFSAGELRRRFDHFALESEVLVPAAAAAFSAGDARGLGDVVDRSQTAAEELLGNQIAETVALANLARKSGAVAASAFGAGFGGSVWALTRRADADRVAREWLGRYAADFPDAASRSETFVTGAGPSLTKA